MKIKFLDSVQTKLSAISIAVMTFVLILLSFSYVYKDYRSYNQQLQESLFRIATLVGDNSLASLLFDDKDSAKDILKSLNTQKNIVAAGLLSRDYNLFATYDKKENSEKVKKIISKASTKAKLVIANSSFEYGNYLLLIKSIVYENKKSGFIYIVYDVSERKDKIIYNILITIILLIVSIILMIVISTYYQNLIIKPLSDLAIKMNQISVTKNFNVSLSKVYQKDEIGWLMRGFNEMLIQLRTRDEEIKEKSAELQYIAYHDNLTKLPNFTLFKEVVGHMISNREEQQFAILFIDLDDFKAVNDNFGHNIGDELLKQVSLKFKDILRMGDYASVTNSLEGESSLARLGGDEFIIMVRGGHKEHNVDAVIKRIFKELCQPVVIDNREIFIKISVGISIYPDDSVELNELIKYADTAMYQAKAKGKNKYEFFNKNLHLSVQRKLLLEREMVVSLEKNQFELYFQPQMDIINNVIVGVEALLRWSHPSLGLIPPDEFISIAENSRFIIILGEWVIKQACKQLKNWQHLVPADFRVAINISPVQFNSDNLISVIQDSILKYELPASSIEIEITENILMADNEFSLKTIDAMKKTGVLFAIDDFGTGYSSFRYLSKFQANILKIDKIFIDDIDINLDNQIIARSIIALAHNMNMKVVAEGVETIEQLNYLKAAKCDIAQGYYFSRPVPSSALELFFLKYS